ncbi:tRNA threonylcarbamoyl adenosine modification protein YeaZ [Rhodopirellula rubra]|uniref:tRNA threonylcarbamoyl adenosine modification protein YeaZ n=1 Tax=Aporhodopirellula rubra TaxID=980271 RepID=A0A7W5DTT8_9BACT|nr:tRNA (adenosine(37)-N6)-threonylcarbamoyltransferase complex dimerization subunit type 1 TsaB [Aporhodopirellula rubra]MBB3204435.1 tRNA threonylcarbamoyl adenosine modification protein YeaZ [Aporhodopirellula rubra]
MNFVQQPMQQELSDSPDRATVLDSLAIEVIGRDGSIALMRGDRLIAARPLDSAARAASSLALEISNLVEEFFPGRAFETLGGISVAVGPGSFTGLRIAVTTAKTLSYALQIPVVAVNSLAAIAELACPNQATPEQPSPTRGSVLVGLSAYRGQVYRGLFSNDRVPEIDLISADQWAAELQRSVGEDAIEGSGCDEAPHLSDEKKMFLMGDRVVFDRVGISLSPKQWFGDDEIRAVGVGRIGAAMLQRGETTPAMDLVPDYLRPSAAEEKASGAIE